MKLADEAFSVKIAVWKNHESNVGMSDKSWVNKPIVLSSLKVTGRDGDQHTELSTTNSSRTWAASGELKESLEARKLAPEEITSISKPYEGTAVDYSTIDGEPIHLSTLASMVMPNVAA